MAFKNTDTILAYLCNYVFLSLSFLLSQFSRHFDTKKLMKGYGN